MVVSYLPQIFIITGDDSMENLLIKNSKGMHARPISKWLEGIKGLDADITVKFKDRTFNGNSMISLMSMGASMGDEIHIESVGKDGQNAIEIIKALVEDGFGEL